MGAVPEVDISPAALPIPNAERALFQSLNTDWSVFMVGVSRGTDPLEGLRVSELSLQVSVEHDDLLEWLDRGHQWKGGLL